MASSYTLSFIPLTVVVPRRSASSSSPSSLIPPPSLIGKKLLVKQPSRRRFFVSKHRFLTSASTVFSVPTAQPENGSSDKIPKWSARAIKSLAMGELEARKLKYPTTGTEAILMGILVEGTSTAAKFLRGNGITLFKVRDEIIKLLGKSDMYFFSPEHPPLTEPARKAVDWAVDQKKKSGVDGELTAAYLLLGVWSQKDSAGRQILESLGFNEDKAKQVTESMNEDVDLSFKKQGQ
ncbi:Double Clp-N motif protein [Raphanus sativus]|uniref:ATP-dependent Clp protease ATP-binding subunit CLPT1, chloroplastic n=1 Tax=Raphanus sativus TaxID=3726 RepID=A0A6J0N3I2_RAPSA|nr:ATP-dependent Clp protease ATP-binding subunit CLPT1, chloroplastic [Raphanus sativus]XP_056862943.1 ATP-dependent Clp protease ATP-binding subunit CLPT1, chloroplastic-like [Raphanus sativus]KAJ4899509.1 Double Clp-N motif protein [Raphanus sativus]